MKEEVFNAHRLVAFMRVLCYYLILAYVHYVLAPREVPSPLTMPSYAMSIQIQQAPQPNPHRDICPQIASAISDKLARRQLR